MAPDLDPQRDFYGIPAFTHRGALAAGIIKRADVLGISGQAKELLPDFTRPGKIAIRHVFPLPDDQNLPICWAPPPPPQVNSVVNRGSLPCKRASTASPTVWAPPPYRTSMPT